MGEIEINTDSKTLIIHSHIITYGAAADECVTENIRDEIETMWNEPKVHIQINGTAFGVMFSVTAQLHPEIEMLEIISNTNPRNNYFRIETFALGNISFVDGLGCNSGYFKLDNLYKGSTTAAHEFGHTLGLGHPLDMDYRGRGVPRIMYPRGTLVDAQYQYDPLQVAGANGGTMHPQHRKVFAEDVAALHLQHLRFNKGRAIAGEFTNVYHEKHSNNPVNDSNIDRV